MKDYIGNGRTIKTQNGSLLKMGFSKADLEKLLDNLNDKGWVNVVAGARKEVGKYGETHSLWIDDWKPDGEPANKPATQEPATESAMPFDDDSIPF